MITLTNNNLSLTFRYGFGNTGNVKYNIPGGATLQYKIKLIAFEKVQKTHLAAMLETQLNRYTWAIKHLLNSSTFSFCDEC